MTANVFDRNTAGFLILIIPLAIVIMILFTAWKWILLFVGISLVWKIWQDYQWAKWSRKIDPVFHQLITENQGCLTPMDLSQKANLDGWTAKQFLEKKAEEFGAQRKKLGEEGTVYYFLTANALGSIFADSDPDLEEDEPETITKDSFSHEPSITNIARILDFEDEAQASETSAKLSVAEEDDIDPTQEDTDDPEQINQSSDPSSLIQSELAKRLDTNASTIGRRKSEPDFPQWSQSRDPQGIAWKYQKRTRTFVPVDSENNPQL